MSGSAGLVVVSSLLAVVVRSKFRNEPGHPAASRRLCRHEHLDAGASHVFIRPVHPQGSPRPDRRVLEALAPGP